MTYCLGLINRFGMVMGADSRTNAGVDYTSAYRKLFNYSLPGDRILILCTSGNLAITQAVLHQIDRDIQRDDGEHLHNIATMHEVATYIGGKVREMQEKDRPWLEKDGIDFQCNFLLGGQIKGEPHQELYLIYPQGNFIQATKETPFLQIGETKYGKPLLDRTITYDTPLEAMAKCALLSIDSTMKSNISVGPPINLTMVEANHFSVRHTLQLRLGDPYLAKMRSLWESYVRQAFESMPNVEWEANQIDSGEDVLID
ncbi:peptidase [Synechocystis sp. LEGE 06083]|uniref:peptidase n=1 Tax=Synechocystis sp. LEGE 06083 TaxID=915336 RepID=UPI00188098DE|nr:peptidase [Synechocystis sp. LEGE 06083]MBE9194989.1 peptidase [Synechocystis sp. LEGE 06083]